MLDETKGASGFASANPLVVHGCGARNHLQADRPLEFRFEMTRGVGFVAVVCALLFVLPLSVEAQPAAKVWRICWLWPSGEAGPSPIAALRASAPHLQLLPPVPRLLVAGKALIDPPHGGCEGNHVCLVLRYIL